MLKQREASIYEASRFLRLQNACSFLVAVRILSDEIN